MILWRLTGLSWFASSMFSARKVFSASFISSSKWPSVNNAGASVPSSLRMDATSVGHELGEVHKQSAVWRLSA